MKFITTILLTFFSQYIYADYRAVVDMNAYNFPPPSGSIHKVLHRYKKGDSVKLTYNECIASTCSVTTPKGESAWIFDFQITNETDLEQASKDYINAGYDEWDSVDFAVWGSVKDNKNRLDKCALQIAHGTDFNPHTDWPAYCNTFRNTREVRDRVNFIKSIMKKFDSDSIEMRKIKAGKIWVGASSEVVLASWGYPEDINATTFDWGKKEQWVYGNSNYVYISNGVVNAIQN